MLLSYFFAIAVINDESKPPDKKIPKGTSDINLDLIEFSKTLLKLFSFENPLFKFIFFSYFIYFFLKNYLKNMLLFPLVLL